jgi:tRNA (guanine10-N2)-methyltransferase
MGKFRGLPMKSYVVNFAQFKEEFRLPELLALCELNEIPITYAPDAYSLEDPYMVVQLPDDESVKKILSRAILIRY